MTSTLLAAATVESTEGLAQSVRLGHHLLTADEPLAQGGTDAGPAPYQLLMASLGACTAITLRMYAQRKGWELGPLTVRLKLLRDETGERVERVLEVAALVPAEQRARLLEIAAKTPVTKTLTQGLRIETQLG